MNIAIWIQLSMLIIAVLGGGYGIIRLIIKSERVSVLEKENEYLRHRIDEKDDALRRLK